MYRRWDTGISVPLTANGDVLVDNRWVVPYNPWFLLKYDCHINVEICSSVKSVKYLYKYVYKGPDCVSVEVHQGPNYNEVQQFIDGRWVSAPEALWKIFQFVMSRIYPPVARLQIHLPNKQLLRFNVHRPISEVLANTENSKTMLTEFFQMNHAHEPARQYLYHEFPEHYRWMSGQKTWVARRGHNKVIRRIFTVSPTEGERFYLRTLLHHVRGPQSFEDLLTVDGVTYPIFKQSAEKRGLLEDDNNIRQCLQEASTFRMPSALRRLFVSILVYCEPNGVCGLFNEFYPQMVEDYACSSTVKNMVMLNKLLWDLKNLLLQHGRNISDYDLPSITAEFDCCSEMPTIIQDELSIDIPTEEVNVVLNLNDDQAFVYTTIMTAIEHGENVVFFVDGPGGTGKTYLYRALLANLRTNGHIALATATSGTTSTILPGGRTAHSRFKIPMKVDASSVCSISKQFDLSALINRASAIIWDEAPMTHRRAFEALDRTLRDITNRDLPFGGKVVILGGDF